MAWIYDGVTSVRNFMYNHGILSSVSYDLPIICVGNLTVGGTGKTPHIEYLIRLLRKEKYTVAVLSRGYKRKTSGFILASESSTADEIGDEPYQIKQKFPDVYVAVDADRREGIRRLMENDETSDVNVILLDDALQHRRVKAGLNIILMDSNRPIYDDHLMPAGRLRENRSGLKRGNMVVVTKLKSDISEETKAYYAGKLMLDEGQTLHFSKVVYGKPQKIGGGAANPLADTEIPYSQLANYNALLVTGIANPAPLDAELSRWIEYPYIHFGDHHRFTAADYNQINQLLAELPDDKPRILLTTEKDAARIDLSLIDSSVGVYVVPIEIEFLTETYESFDQNVLDFVSKSLEAREKNT